MNAIDQILDALSSQPLTRHELQAVTGLRYSTMDSALARLRRTQQIEVRPISVEYGGPGSHPGRSGRPKGATVAYCAGGDNVMPILQIYQDSKGYGRCRSCGAPIEWAELISGKRHPFDAPIVVTRTQGSILDEGRVIEEVDTAVSTTHFATCPQRREWKKRA